MSSLKDAKTVLDRKDLTFQEILANSSVDQEILDNKNGMLKMIEIIFSEGSSSG